MRVLGVGRIWWKVWIAANATSAIGREREVLARVAEHAEDDAGADRHPAGGDGEAHEPRLDAGRGLVARGQRGREAAEPFGWFASGHSELLPAAIAGLFTSGFTRFVGSRKRILRALDRCRLVRGPSPAARRLAGRAHGRAHGRDRLGEVDRGAACSSSGARSSSTPTRSRARWSSRARRRWPRSSRRSAPRSCAPTGRSTGPRSRRVRSSTTRRARSSKRSRIPRSARSSCARSRRRRPTRIVVHDVPLLVESKRGFDYGAVIVVEAPLELRLDRLEARGVAARRRRAAHRRCRPPTRSAARWPPGWSTTRGDLAAPRDADRRDLARARSAAPREEPQAASERRRGDRSRFGERNCLTPPVRSLACRIRARHRHGARRRPAGGDRRARSTGSSSGDRFQTLLGITGSGKSFTIANVIAKAQRPTLVLAPEQVARRAARGRVPGDLPEEPGRVLRLLLRLLPARGVPPVDRHVHREGQLDQRRDRPAAPLGHERAAHPARRDHRRVGLGDLRPRFARAVRASSC